MTRRVFKAAGGLLVLGLALGAVLLLRPGCVIFEATGFYCAGCGTQRMLLALLGGEVALAARNNIFMLIFLPATALYLLVEAVRYVKEKPPLCRSRWFWSVLCGVLVLAGVFTLLRNLPGFGWLAPLPA